MVWPEGVWPVVLVSAEVEEVDAQSSRMEELFTLLSMHTLMDVVR